MAQAKLSLTWDAHQKNICNGLSIFQQRGEFVDMTLAADGHHVKVHQMVMALVSPYIKDLISSASCPHPIIFLNNISYTTLCGILEYIYTGEVLVPKSNLGEFIAASKALHIKGLKEMDTENSLLPLDESNVEKSVIKEDISSENSMLFETLQQYKEKKKMAKESSKAKPPVLPVCKVFVDEEDKDTDVVMDSPNHSADEWDIDKQNKDTNHSHDSKEILSNTNVRFTVSNQGGLQIIYNRYIYHLRYVQKNRTRLWRCIDYSSTLKCPGRIFTNENNEVTKRSHNHNHGFHDEKIVKKIRLGTVYGGFQEAENEAQSKKNERNLPCTPPRDETNRK